MLVLLGTVVWGIWKSSAPARPAPTIYSEDSSSVDEKEEEGGWIGHLGDSYDHSLAFHPNRPHSSMNTADTHTCICTQETCKGVSGTEGQRIEGVTDLEPYQDGWICVDQVFGTRRQRAPDHGPVWPAERRPSPLKHTVERGHARRQRPPPSQWSEEEDAS